MEQAAAERHTATGVPSGAAAALPAGIVPYGDPLTNHDYIVCDPRDMKAADDLILWRATEIRKTMSEDGILYPVIAEEHQTIIPRMAQAGFLENLAAAPKTHGKTFFMDESPRNILQLYAHIVYKIDTPADMHRLDPLGHIFARAILAKNRYPSAPESQARILNTCLRHAIPIIPVDAAFDNALTYLDPSDPLAVESTRKLFKINLCKTRICYDPSSSAYDPRAVIIRNDVMAQRIATAAERERKACTAVIGTGCDHAGENSEKPLLAYSTTLTAFLKEWIRPQDRMLSVFFAKDAGGERLSKIPDETWRKNPDALILRNTDNMLSQKGIAYRPQGGKGIPEMSEDEFITILGQSYDKVTIPAHFGIPACPDPDDMKRKLKTIARAARSGPSGPSGTF